MSKTQEMVVYSKPTKCVRCTVVVEMTHSGDADPKAGSWQCPNCRHLYRFAHWKIQKGGKRARVKERQAS